MAQMTDAADWTLLGGEPAPGDVEVVREVAGRYRAATQQAAACREGVAAHGGAAANGWSGTTATAYQEAMAAFAAEVVPLESAADLAAAALDGFAEALASLQATATDLLAVALQAEAERSEAETSLAALHEELTVSVDALALARQRWEVTQAQADDAEVALDPSSGELQAMAGQMRIALNDAAQRLADVESQIVAVRRDLADTEAILESARAEASRLREELRTHALVAAARLEPVAPYGLDLVAATAPAAAGTAAAPPAAPVAPPLAGAPRPATGPTSGMHQGQPPSAGTPTPLRGPATAMSTAAVRSVLAAVRLGGGAPVPVAKIQPKLEVFRTFQRLGLQAVTARGGAIARALGFEGVIGGLGTRPYPSDHSRGLALDLMTYDDVASGEALAAFYVEHHEELGVTYVIWNGRIASPRDDWAWRPYRHPAGRTDPTAMHLDHVHISFDPDDNAYACACFGVTS